MLYEYRQNNSGGTFVINKKLDVNVWIEASSPSEANKIAEMNGIYFDGCYDGIDCPCCGDRWHEVADDFDAVSEDKISHILHHSAKRLSIIQKNGTVTKIGMNLQEISWKQHYNVDDVEKLMSILEEISD